MKNAIAAINGIALADAAPTPTGGALVAAADQLDQNAAAVYLASLAPGSRPAMQGALNTLARLLGAPRVCNELGKEITCLFVNWAALRFQHTAALRAKLAETYKARTANKVLSALRGTLKAAWRLEQMDAETYRRAIDLERIDGETLPRGRALTSGEIAALMTACANDPTPSGARDAAILALLRVSGLRRAEVCALTLADYDPESGLVIRGKRNKERRAFVENGAADALRDWLEIRGNERGALFCPIIKGGRVVIRHMYAEAVFFMLRKRAAEPGVKNLSPHDWRRTFAGDLLDAGADIATVQKLMGHSDPATTARYDRRGEETRRRAVALLHVPYHKRIANARKRARIGQEQNF